MKWVWLAGAIFFVIQMFLRVGDDGWLFWVDAFCALIYITNFVIVCADDERKRHHDRN